MDWPILAGVPPESVRELLSIARRRTFARNEVVFHQGDAANALHLVAKGRFAIRVLTPLGHSAMLDVLGPGDVFGEIALITHEGVRSAAVGALEAGETFAVYREEFSSLRARHPDVTDVLLAIVAERLKRANERITVAHYMDVEDRVRWSVTRLADTFRRDDGAVVIPLTQEQLAELAGAARATVNRVLREEQERGTIVLTRGRIEVVDLASLARRTRGVPRI